ncbi:hypothetical protein CJ030_MR1G011828 [Morella rubra]|uniref:Uncharacterized protein n=1 Tax=Morella rubra TaxID=262757 RepID=A0A6A1WNM2_9ROSI|nr:hypothetical protein CJ030_MR1G011828 [Morella rubra]
MEALQLEHEFEGRSFVEGSNVKIKMLPIPTKFHHQFLDHLMQAGKTFDNNVDGDGDGAGAGISASDDGADSAGASVEAAKD